MSTTAASQPHVRTTIRQNLVLLTSFPCLHPPILLAIIWSSVPIPERQAGVPGGNAAVPWKGTIPQPGAERSVAPGKTPLHSQAESRRHPGGGLSRGKPVVRPESIRLPGSRVAGLQPARTVVRPSWGACPRLWNCGLSGRPEAVRVPAIADQEQGVAQPHRPPFGCGQRPRQAIRGVSWPPPWVGWSHLFTSARTG